MTTFICSECGRDLPMNKLSLTSLELAGTTSPTKAVEELHEDDVICQSCDHFDPADYEDVFIEPGRTPRERFELCGTHLSDGMKIFYQNNY